MISSMTKEERTNPKLIDRSRRNRIARGSGTEPADINKLVKEFDAMSGMMKEVAGMSSLDKVKAVQKMASGGLFNPGANLNALKGSTKSTSPNAKALADKKKKQRKDAKKQKKKNR